MASKAFLEKAYLAYFGRPVDYTGSIAFANASEADVTNAFYASAESKALYGTTFGATQINAVYKMLFGRDAEPAGLAYWSNEVAAGRLSPAGAALGILNGALNADKTAVENKLTSSAAFTAALDTTAEILGYAGDTAAASARTWLGTITTTAATAAAVTTAVSSATTTTASGSSGVAGNTYTLTNAADTFGPTVGTSANVTTVNDDTFRATAAGHLDTADYIDGGSGADTLNVSAQSAAIKPILKSVETLNVLFDNAAGALDMADSTGYTMLYSKASTNAGAAAGAFTNVDKNAAVGLMDHNLGGTFVFASTTGTTDAATLNVADTNGGTATVAGIEKLTIGSKAGNVAAVTTNAITVTAAAADAITVTGDQALTLTLGNSSPNLTSFDASGFAKALTLNFTSVAATTTAAVTLKGGSGADSFAMTDINTGAKLTLDLGAGNDTLTIRDSAFHKVTLGDGIDTTTLTTTAGVHKALSDVTSAAKLAADVIEITDFKSGTDVLNIVTAVGNATAETNLTGTQLTAAANASTFLAALQSVDGNVANVSGNFAAFQYGADTYVWMDGGGDGLSTADVIIKLTGVTAIVAADIVGA